MTAKKVPAQRTRLVAAVRAFAALKGVRPGPWSRPKYRSVTCCDFCMEPGSVIYYKYGPRHAYLYATCSNCGSFFEWPGQAWRLLGTKLAVKALHGSKPGKGAES